MQTPENPSGPVLRRIVLMVFEGLLPSSSRGSLRSAGLVPGGSGGEAVDRA
ncbi:MAG: hypothetical protein WAK40_05805 [Thermoplasmata archaeon]